VLSPIRAAAQGHDDTGNGDRSRVPRRDQQAGPSRPWCRAIPGAKTPGHTSTCGPTHQRPAPRGSAQPRPVGYPANLVEPTSARVRLRLSRRTSRGPRQPPLTGQPRRHHDGVQARTTKRASQSIDRQHDFVDDPKLTNAGPSPASIQSSRFICRTRSPCLPRITAGRVGSRDPLLGHGQASATGCEDEVDVGETQSARGVWTNST
jgi:hypothetical protein